MKQSAKTPATLTPMVGMVTRFPPCDRLAFYLLLVLLTVQLLFVVATLNRFYVIDTPKPGGSVHEGIIDLVIHRNPLYAESPGEKTLAALLHAGLLRHASTGELLPHLASHYSQNEDGTFTFLIRGDARFHDGHAVTATDVVTTVAMLRDRDIDPYAPWHGVTAQTIDTNTVVIAVPDENTAFPRQFTTPILPHRVWKKVPADQRKRYRGSGVHLGAGPFRHDSEVLQNIDQPRQITLVSFPAYVLGQPYLDTITLHFYRTPSELVHAYYTGEIDALHSISPADLPSLVHYDRSLVYTATTDRLFGIFFNTEDGRLLQNPFLRTILSQYVDRDRIVTDIFHDYATAIQAPLPSDTTYRKDTMPYRELTQTLDDIGWVPDTKTGFREKDGIPLTISLLIPDIVDMRKVARSIMDDWKKLGVEVTVTVAPPKVLHTAIARRDFDAVIYGYQANQAKDLVALWKSSDDTNIASITSFGSQTLNQLLTELAARTPPERFSTVSSDRWRSLVYDEAKVEILQSAPAIFLYSPHFLFVTPKTLEGVGVGGAILGHVTEPQDRFADVHTWHTKREQIWRFIQTHNHHDTTTRKSSSRTAATY